MDGVGGWVGKGLESRQSKGGNFLQSCTSDCRWRGGKTSAATYLGIKWQIIGFSSSLDNAGCLTVDDHKRDFWSWRLVYVQGT